MLQGNTLSFIFYLLYLFEEVPVKLGMRYTPFNQIYQGRIKMFYLIKNACYKIRQMFSYVYYRENPALKVLLL